MKIRLIDFWLEPVENATWLRVKCKKGQILENSAIVFTEKNKERKINFRLPRNS